MQVYKATRRGITLVAVKKFKFQLDEVAVKMIYREIAILRKASDQNIVQFYGASVTDSALLCMEYMEVSPTDRRAVLGFGVIHGA